MTTRIAGLAVLLVAVAPLSAIAAAAASGPADLVVTDARIYTATADHAIAEALAVRDGKIVYVGPAAGLKDLTGPKTRVEHLGGKLVLPGLVDSHIHPAGIVDLDVCTLKSEGKTLKALAEFVRGCIEHYKIPAGEWVSVRQWNYTSGNEPDAANPTLRAALDHVSTKHPVQLLGNDGHHGAYNSLALARAKDDAGKTVGYSAATLAGSLKAYRNLVGVDEKGEPNGTVNEDARRRMDTPSTRADDIKELMKAPERIVQRMNSVGITGFLDASVRPEWLPLYDALGSGGKMSARAELALFFDPDVIKTPAGQPDWALMVSTAKASRAKYANNPLIHADFVKLFADGVLEGNPYATPPTLPEVGSVKPYLQPIFKRGADGHPTVSGYVDTAAALCVEVRAHPEKYSAPANSAAFLKEHGYHPDQCRISTGQMQHERPVILEYVKQFHQAGFSVHIHAIGDLGIRTAIDAIEAARAADGNSKTHDGLAHVQLVAPGDAARIGRDHLYLALTYAWISTDPEYDISVVPFFDKVNGAGYAAMHPAGTYYDKNAYPVKTMKDAGAILLGGSDAPVETSDPRPFINMSMAVTRSAGGRPPLNAAESVSIRDVVDAYTINGARFLNIDKEAGSLEAGKSADFIVLDRDILALADGGKAADVANTKVLSTWFKGQKVYSPVKP